MEMKIVSPSHAVKMFTYKRCFSPRKGMAWEMFLKGYSPIKGEIHSVLQAKGLTYAKNLAQAAQTLVAMRDIGGITYSTKGPGALIHSLMQKPLASKKWRI